MSERASIPVEGLWCCRVEESKMLGAKCRTPSGFISNGYVMVRRWLISQAHWPMGHQLNKNRKPQHFTIISVTQKTKVVGRMDAFCYWRIRLYNSDRCLMKISSLQGYSSLNKPFSFIHEFQKNSPIQVAPLFCLPLENLTDWFILQIHTNWVTND